MAEWLEQGSQEAASLPFHIEREMSVGVAFAVGKLVLSRHIDEAVNTITTDIRHV